MSKAEFLKIVKERGYIHQCTNLEGFDDALINNIITGYIGFDCTAKSFHVGNLISIMLLRLLQKTGHKPIVVMGGGTTKIGDPSGKDEARQMLNSEQINNNKQSLAATFSKFINFGNGKNDAIMVDNAEWLDEIKYIDFLRDYGKHFTINRMLTFDSVKLRLEREQPLSFLEFNYMLLQAYDFVELNRRYGCRLQMGGSDQWGNIVNGVDLGRRLGTSELFGLTSELITTKSGKKMGKTAEGAIWLNQDMLSAYDYWQFWRNTEDADVKRFLLLYTELPISEIEKLGALKDKEINEAKIILANEATKLCHGEEAAKAAFETAKKVFSEGTVGGEIPVYNLNTNQLNENIPAFKMFVIAGLCSSNGEARRLIQGKGAKINNEQILDENEIISNQHFNDKGEMKLSFGQKKHVLVKIS
jgi:tyrosyl-tRNA synthetase